MDTTERNGREIGFAKTMSFEEFLNKIGNCHSLNELLDTFCSSNIEEVRWACLQRMETLTQYYDKYFCDSCDTLYTQVEEVIIQLFNSSSFFNYNSKMALKLLEIYVFIKNGDVVQRAINFAISIINNRTTNVCYLNQISKIVCSRLNSCHHFFNNYDEEGELIIKDPNELFPGLKKFLLAVWDNCKTVWSGELTKDKPQEIRDFFMIERALKVVIYYHQYSQSFLPLIEEMLMLHKSKLLFFRVKEKDSFAEAKNLAVLKEAAKILHKAQKDSARILS